MDPAQAERTGPGADAVDALATEPAPPGDGEPARPPGMRRDLAVLLKIRLNTFVLITTFFGYLLATLRQADGWAGLWQSLEPWRLLHTLIGTGATAFGSAAFNQLMEVDLDARMSRTADRPLPARRLDPLFAFGIGWVLAAFGIIHLAAKVGDLAAYLTAGTLALYVFIYTPLKRFSSINTLVGAVPGAVPPVIGWVAAGGALGWEAGFLFGLLFLWQLPHFLAINWICRDEYEQAGYKMWSNGDHSGRRTAVLAAVFSLVLVLFSLLPWLLGFGGLLWLIGGTIAGLAMVVLAARFRRQGTAESARRLFLYTLLYLPLALGLLALGWR
jgi:protoheme IX farnesyltransferase